MTTAREREEAVVDRCIQLVTGLHGPSGVARTAQEANVFALAAHVIRSRHPKAAEVLGWSGALYFKQQPSERLGLPEVMRRGWIISLPRLREMLERRLCGFPVLSPSDSSHQAIAVRQYTGLHTRTPLALGLHKLFAELAPMLQLSRPVDVYLAGGMAIHLYTGDRLTSDVNAEFSARVHVPSDLLVEVRLEDGSMQSIYLDIGYNPSFVLRHDDHRNDAIPVELDTAYLRLHVLSPVDLALSKIARYSEIDRNDIRALVQLRLVTAADLGQRARDAMENYIGGSETVDRNLEDVKNIRVHRSAIQS